MEKSYYRRDLPDGSTQYFSHRLEKPDEDQKYFDDIIEQQEEDRRGESLEFLHFGREQSYPNRVLNRVCKDYILHYVTRGRGRFNGREITAGNGFLVVPGVAHSMESDSCDPWQFKWIAFQGNDAVWQMRSIGLDADTPFFSFSFSEQLDRLFDDVIYRGYEDCDLNTYMQGVFYIIMSYHKKQMSRSGGQADSSERYAAQAVRYMDEHYRETIRAEDIARSLHISRKYLCSVLERYRGVSTKEYLLMRRVDAAAELLLHTDMTVSEIAAEVGYGDYTQLSRMFRQKKGESPQQFRKRKRAQKGNITTE